MVKIKTVESPLKQNNRKVPIKNPQRSDLYTKKEEKVLKNCQILQDMDTNLSI